MNLGMYLHDAPADNFWDRLGFALEQGFSTFYMSPARVLPGFETADAPTRLDGHLAEQVRCALELTGLSCTAMGCACDPSAPDAEAVYRAHFRLARRIGTAVCPEADQDAVIRMLPRLAAWASEEGATLTVRLPANTKALPDLPTGVDVILDAGTTVPNADLRRRLECRVRAIRLPAPDVLKGGAALVPLFRLAGSNGLPLLLSDVTGANADAVRRWIEGTRAGMIA